MGIESDQLVYDYLSRVGDLAQTTLPAARRRGLVTKLRNDIDRERREGDSPAAVRRILGRLGSPDEVVQAAALHPEPARRDEPAPPPPPAVPRPAAPTATGPLVPAGPAVPAASGGGPQRPRADGEPEWWRVPSPHGGSAARTNAILAGWTGGLEIPEFDEDAEGRQNKGKEGDGEAAAQAAVEAGAARSRWRLRLPLRRPASVPPAAAAAGTAAAAPRRRGLPVGPVELVAALALVAGVVLRSWLPLAVGWLISYGSRRLSRAEAKWAALGVPGLVATGALVWLWGRTDGRWGQPLPSGQLGPAISADFPAVVRIAAIASALFLLWRSARRTG